jgi:hypothetical protein
VFVACFYSHPPRAGLKTTVHIGSVSPRNPQHPAISHLFSPLTSLLLVTIVTKRWGSSRPTYLGVIRISPESPTISSSESSLLEGQTLGRRASCSECVRPQRVQMSTGVINRDIARGYVFVPQVARSISLSSQVQLDPTIEVGRAFSY